MKNVIDGRSDPNQGLFAPEDSNNSDKNSEGIVDELQVISNLCKNESFGL